MRLHEEHDASSLVEETSPAESQLPTMFSFMDEEISEDIPESVSQSEIFPIIQPPSTLPPAAIPSEQVSFLRLRNLQPVYFHPVLLKFAACN